MWVQTFPNKSWEAYERALRLIGERQRTKDDDAFSFLSSLGLVRSACVAGEYVPELTTSGRDYFAARFIRQDHNAADEILKNAVMSLPPAEAICQLLYGVKSATRETAETVLRSQGFAENSFSLSDRKIGSLLMLMNRVGVIRYNKQDKSLEVLEPQALEQDAPDSIFISPEKPYSNRARLRQVIGQLEGDVCWLDKHFMPVAFEDLSDALDGNNVTEVRLLSLELPDNSGKKARRDYKDIKAELQGRSIKFEWRTIDSTEVKRTHDRWIIGDNSAWNMPNVNSIYSGQHSEMHKSANGEELRKLFDQYWAKAKQHS